MQSLHNSFLTSGLIVFKHINVEKQNIRSDSPWVDKVAMPHLVDCLGMSMLIFHSTAAVRVTRRDEGAVGVKAVSALEQYLKFKKAQITLELVENIHVPAFSIDNRTQTTAVTKTEHMVEYCAYPYLDLTPFNL